jgi:hypothetical protein
MKEVVHGVAAEVRLPPAPEAGEDVHLENAVQQTSLGADKPRNFAFLPRANAEAVRAAGCESPMERGEESHPCRARPPR